MASQIPKPFHCSDCGKEFSKEKNLISHFKVHATEKSYKCEVCKTTFYTKTLYKNHAKTHVEKGNYPCPKCGKVFVRSSWLKRHVSLQCDEIKQRENKFMCKDCGKSYDSLTGVKSHIIKGKHSETEFKCHECSWSCTSSKTLFVHVLQHNTIDVIIVGYSEEKRLEYYSTAKVRSKLAKYQPRVQVASQEGKLSEPAMETKDASNLNGKNKLSPVESSSQNMIVNGKTFETKKLPLSDEENTKPHEDLSHSQSSVFTDNAEDRVNGNKLQDEKDVPVINLEEENGQNLEAALRNGWIKARLTSERKNIFENKLRESQEKSSEISPTTENKTCESTTAGEKHALPATDAIPKKMPKLLSLYPEEEESLKDTSSSKSNNSLLMQSEVPIDHGIVYNNIPPQISTLMNNQLVMPFSTPLVNTMFLPPLFIVPTTVPLSHGFSQQPPIQIQKDTSEKTIMHRDTYENQHKISKLADSSAIDSSATDICKTANDEEMRLNRRRKQLKADVHRHTDLAKQLTQDVSKEKILVPDALENGKAQGIQDIKSDHGHGKAKDADDVLLDQKVTMILDNIKNQLNEMQEADDKSITLKKEIMTSNKRFNTDDADQNKSDNHIWDTLMGGESNNKSGVYSKHLSLYDIFQPNGYSQDAPDGKEILQATQEDNFHRKINGRAAVRNKQHGAKGGINVEDYIKKFMWF